MDHTMPNSTTNHIDMRKDWIFIQHTIPREIAAFLEDAFFIVEIRQRVGEIKGISFQVRSREHNHSIPHVHASYPDFMGPSFENIKGTIAIFYN